MTGIFSLLSMIVLYLTCYIAPGIYHGTLNFDPNSDDHIDSTQLHPYPAVSPDAPPGTSAAEVPVSISLTEFHFILLYRDRIVGISTLNGKQTYEDFMPLVSRTFRRRLYCC